MIWLLSSVMKVSASSRDFLLLLLSFESLSEPDISEPPPLWRLWREKVFPISKNVWLDPQVTKLNSGMCEGCLCRVDNLCDQLLLDINAKVVQMLMRLRAWWYKSFEAKPTLISLLIGCQTIESVLCWRCCAPFLSVSFPILLEMWYFCSFLFILQLFITLSSCTQPVTVKQVCLLVGKPSYVI